ncbi:MAG: hypothetical protein WBW92_07955 [Rhodanobacteraceae bacterium]
MRVLVCLLLALACLPVSLARAQGTGSAYAVDYDQFYRVDLATRQATSIGPVSGSGPQQMADLSGLTTTPDGRLFAASDTLKALIRIDPATGKGTVVGSFDINQTQNSSPLDFGMAASCDGSLWLSSTVTRQLWKVSPSTGKASLVGQMGNDIAGLAVDHDALYGVGGRGDEGWYSINTQTGQSTLLGGLGSMVDYITSASPVITDQGQVLAAFNYVPLPNNQPPPDWSDLAQINIANGQTTVLGTITGSASLRGIGIRGFTMGPPPCGVTGTPPDAVGAPTLAWWSRILMLFALAGIALVLLARKRNPEHA